MKTQEYVLQGGLSFTFAVPETVEEYNRLAKDDGAVLQDAIDNVMYRGPFARIRERLAQEVEKDSGIARATKPHPNKDKAAKGETVYDESPGAYLSRAAAEQGKDSAGEAFQSILDRVLAENAALPDGDAKKIVFDPSERVSQGRGAQVGKGDIAAAQTILEAEKANPGKLAIVLQKVSATIGRTVTLEGDDAAQLKTLALAYKDYRTALAKVQSLLG